MGGSGASLNPRTWEAEAGGSLSVPVQSGLHSETLPPNCKDKVPALHLCLAHTCAHRDSVQPFSNKPGPSPTCL